MTRAMWFAPVAALTLLAGYLGITLGVTLGKPLTETDVITGFAARYVAQMGAGADRADCFGVPHMDAEIWIVVHCTHPDGRSMSAMFDPNGRMIPQHPGPAA